ncbi:hypothetical protein BCV69DRAFT_282408 [Microstroma glucosiphilum]|uniref:Uncharacterized protein n=1 Tax=Pseudomicrostroma glucosiphilum TaxID=1684307 RepID=A0A316UCX8_9BASI|nr:hypothetical protein BCV69DRAFT_282408 [Pseudomicrostroma glucosiphilum]PWN20895.1 hypothetical protein BCV69DRAFT_282408 [Pseudomicrostroma glucosiphilum]
MSNVRTVTSSSSSTAPSATTQRGTERPSGFDTPGEAAGGRNRTTPARPNTTVTTVSVDESVAFPTEDGHVRFADQPEDWAADVRGMPRYRPLNTELDSALRPLGANGGERFFLTFMLSGVLVQQVANRVWNNTIGRFPMAEKWFVFKIGGQW